MEMSRANKSRVGSSVELVFAADLGGTHLRAATIDREGRIHERVKHKTPKADRANEIVFQYRHIPSKQSEQEWKAHNAVKNITVRPSAPGLPGA